MKKFEGFSVAVALLSLAACASPSYHEKETRTTYDTDEVIHRQKEAYIRTTEKHIKDIESKLGTWRLEAREASSSTREARNEYVTDLEKKIDKARKELNRLKMASMKDYDQIKEDVEDAIEDLDDEFKEARPMFK